MEQEPTTKKRDYSNIAQNFNGARGSNDQEKMLAKGTPLVQQIKDPLHGDTDCWNQIVREKPVHRTMSEMSVQGYDSNEIAKFTGYNVHHVRKILRQPFAREHIIKTIKKTVQDEMKEFLEAEVLPSLKVLKAVRDGAEVRNQDRLAASNALLDRYLGKPVQPINNDAKPVSDLSDEELKAEVQRELAKSQAN